MRNDPSVNRKVWDNLSALIERKKLSWSDVARELDVPISTINSKRINDRDIGFGLMASMLNLLGFNLVLTTPDKESESIVPYLRALMKQKISKSLLVLSRTDSMNLLLSIDSLSAEIQENLKTLVFHLQHK